ncbi:MAG: 16S rRNA (guanine(527)-N(7))-methyltransferase RsmG [Phycisphaerales bacterium JB038]
MEPTRLVPVPASEAFLIEAGNLGIEFDAGDVETFGLYLAHLLETNKLFNLTRITDVADAWMRHIFDSLTLLPILAAVGAESLCDVGSGGGAPGMPLAIALPQLQVTLLEATGKKAKFCADTAEALGLANVVVINERAETVGQDHHGHREQFDAVCARALGKINVAAELTAPLARVGGLVLLIKGEQAEADLAEAERALEKLGLAHSETIDTPTGRIVVLEKERRTPRLYPRRPGEPKRAPLR